MLYSFITSEKNMPSSSRRGKKWISNVVNKINAIKPIKNVLDIGVGRGTYSNLFKNQLPNSTWVGIEVWKEYIDKYELNEKYDVLINDDARHIKYDDLTTGDLAFAGDVLEHMTKQEAVELTDNILSKHSCLIVSIPIIFYPQGAAEGNPYEVHVKPDWSDEEFLETFDKLMVDHAVDHEIGVYLLSKNQDLIENYKKKVKIKIAVYTIAKNESHFVDRWCDSNKEADLRLVCDTGSTDDTIKKLKDQNVSVISTSIIPWRFDVARNTALNLLPKDIDVCIWQDLDEMLLPGWRQELEKIWEENTTVVNHRYRNNNNPWQWHSKIHARHNCIWQGVVHETLKWSVPEKEIWTTNIYLDEKQDTEKNRKNYMQLLEKKISEGDRDWKTFYFLANDQQSQGMMTSSIASRINSFKLCNDNDKISRAYIAKNIASSYYQIEQYEQTEKWYRISLDYGDERETWFSISEYYYNREMWDQCYIAATKCISIITKRDGYTYDPRAWGCIPYDYAAISAYSLGLKNKAIEYGTKAIELSPDDERLKNNLDQYHRMMS